MENRLLKRNLRYTDYKMNDPLKIEFPSLTTLAVTDLRSTTESSSSVVSQQTPGNIDGGICFDINFFSIITKKNACFQMDCFIRWLRRRL